MVCSRTLSDLLTAKQTTPRNLLVECENRNCTYILVNHTYQIWYTEQQFGKQVNKPSCNNVSKNQYFHGSNINYGRFYSLCTNLADYTRNVNDGSIPNFVSHHASGRSLCH